jgi:restriction system-associated AAA family ATPase
MKLLKLTIGNIPENFRSLHPGFEINFHSLSDTEAMEQFRPFCFAGLNGSGKSNVLEALANIFYHLEICVARYLPDSMRDIKNFNRNICSPDAFTLEYLIGQHNTRVYSLVYFHKVIVEKKVGEAPKMFIQEFPFHKDTKKIEIELNPTIGSEQSAPGKSYLPDHIIGYSSGENEILSVPFIKSRLVHLDEYKQNTQAGAFTFVSSENSLIYINSNMSQAVLLACLLLENDEALKPIKDIDNTGIVDLKSFRMNINLHKFEFQNDSKQNILLLLENDKIDKLKKCATSWYSNSKHLILDFYVNDATKAAFKHHFEDNPFELFQVFQILYELNSHFIKEGIKRDVYQSKGIYTDGKLPYGSPNDNVFYFLDFYITKKFKKDGVVKDLLLREFSDGEHQFLHTVGICLLLKGTRSLLLLDEPETHFNPNWRANFIKILNESITAGNKRNYPNGSFNVHYLKDILLTSHSPFIISDCLPDNVILFEKNDKGVLSAKKASELGIVTYGTSVNLLTNRIFKNKETIGKYALSKLNDYKKKFAIAQDKQQVIDELNEEFGDSIEKLLLIKELTNK